MLFVDDEPHVLRGLVRILRYQPFRVFTVSSAPKALKFLERYQVDIIVSDENMPEMTGSALLREVNRHFPRTVRMLLTGQRDLDALAPAMDEAKVFRCLVKPVDPVLLVASLRDALLVRG